MSGLVKMEKKPLKRNEQLVKLSKDHHSTLLFCWKVRTGLRYDTETERIKKYVQYFWTDHMLPHFFEEESILFADVQDTAVQRARDEHGKIAQQIKALDVEGASAAHQLSAIADAVENHVRYEERELFPHLEKVLTQDQLESIGKQIEERHNGGLKDTFADEFWLKNKNGL
jgi:hemerythrin-like domain-containing protein